MSKIILRQIIRVLLLNEAVTTLAIPGVKSSTAFGDGRGAGETAMTIVGAIAASKAAGFVRKVYSGIKSRATKLGGAVKRNPKKAAGVIGVALGALYLLWNKDDAKQESDVDIEAKAKLESDVIKEIDEKLQNVSNVAVVDVDTAKADIKDGTYKAILDKAKSDFIRDIVTYSNIMSAYYPNVVWSASITDEMQAEKGVIHLLAALNVNDYITGAIFAQYAAAENDKSGPVHKYAQKMIDEIESTPIMKDAFMLQAELEKAPD